MRSFSLLNHVRERFCEWKTPYLQEVLQAYPANLRVFGRATYEDLPQYLYSHLYLNNLYTCIPNLFYVVSGSMCMSVSTCTSIYRCRSMCVFIYPHLHLNLSLYPYVCTHISMYPNIPV